MKTTLHFAVILALLSPLGHARARVGGSKTQTTESKFKALDKNGDSLLSKDEFSAGATDPSKAAEEFSKLDSNKDDTLTLEEFSARTSAPLDASQEGGQKPEITANPGKKRKKKKADTTEGPGEPAAKKKRKKTDTPAAPAQ